MLSLELLPLRADLVRTFRDLLQIPYIRSRTPVGSAAAEQRYKKRLELFADPHHLSNRTNRESGRLRTPSYRSENRE